MILKELITIVSGNLGDRASGEIGGQEASTVVLRGCNLGITE